MTGRTWRTVGAAVIVVVLGGTACSGPPTSKSETKSETMVTAKADAANVVTAPVGQVGLTPVTLPDFSRMADPVQKQMAEQVSRLRRAVADLSRSPADLSAEYGRLGTLLMAAEQLDAAEPCYRNAQHLAPTDARWPYYLGQLYRIKGPIAQAATSFERALQLQSEDVPTLVWLGEVYLTQGRVDEAGRLFSTVLAKQPTLVPALFGAGRVALSRQEYAAAVKLFEQCLTLDPRATATHYPLGMAYRGLGNATLAQVHLAQPGDVKISPVDPLMAALDEALESPRAYDIRGGRLLETGDWANAAAQFRKGLDLEPTDPALRLRLGTALFQMGDPDGAREQFEQVLRASPTYARAHYSLGILAAAGGRQAEAIDRFTAAVTHGPTDPAARVALGGLLRRAGRDADALLHYEQAVRLDARNPEATLGYAITLASLGRDQDARARLLEATKAYPDEPEFAHALARLLATSRDPRVRDGRRALQIAEELMKGRTTTALGETLAMALAEVGQFDRAVRVQRDVMLANERAGLPDVDGAMRANLQRYESRQPSRTPWPRE